MISLDCEKAFDKVYQDELINAARRMNIPEEMTQALETFYDNPRSRFKEMEGKSTWRKQETGKRQGAQQITARRMAEARANESVNARASATQPPNDWGTYFDGSEATYPTVTKR